MSAMGFFATSTKVTKRTSSMAVLIVFRSHTDQKIDHPHKGENESKHR